MNIRPITDNDRSIWDEYVHSHPDASPYHLYGWMVAVEKAYNFGKIGLVAENDGRVVGVLPLIILKIPFCKPVFVSLPYCDVGSTLAENEMVEELLLAEAIAMAQKAGASALDLRSSLPNFSEKQALPVEKTENKVRMLLELQTSSDELWNGFKSKLRSQIRKAEKNGLRFEIANKKTDLFYDVFSQNMRDLGSPVHSRKMIKEVVSQFGDCAELGLVFKENLPIGAGLILRVGNKVSIPWASTLRSHNRLGPNMLLYWGFLQYASDNGCTLFDFGRSTRGEGTYRFKAQWGAQPQPLIWNRILFTGTVPTEKEPTSRNKEIIAGMWRKLPIPVANCFGPLVRKYISL
ncbi:FemAB family XrtA/PEP-CTERM system-associated protein [Desulfogranum marinum]|uniref:FemAB family XrtA/PEP-CTERM system-associated protein n=1 Tax=Desulfogranum marinum TaxID=453220 RepID=UPI001966451F|nr:FemAB family XrtA/PEP-CTERM system-associated protein [Desulfogranum marinum]MBM9514551.1 FemAB family PEP-CTERM system-associated protein [Desulfogranum marinum]